VSQALLQFIGLANYFRDHVPNITETVQPRLKLTWTDEAIEAFHFCRVAVSNCQDTETPILQTDAFDYGIGGYLYMIVNHQVRVIRFFRKHWSDRN